MLLGNLDVGGAERTALELAKALRAGGAEIQAAALLGGGPLGQAFRDANIPLYEGLLRFRFDVAAAMRVAKLLRRERIDTILLVDIYRNAMFCGLWGAAWSGRAVRRILWCSAVPTGQAGDFTPRLRRALRRGRLDEIVCVSDWQRRLLETYDLPAGKMRTIHNGVDADRFVAAPAALPASMHDAPVLLHVANVMPDKDFETLLIAAKLLLQREMKFHLLLAGRGTDSPAMQAEIDRLGLGDCVHALGLRGDVPQLLAAAKALVLSTRSEVFNIAVLEAFAAGRVVIVSDVPGFAEMFENECEGLKVAPGDPAALADAIERLLGDDDLRARLAGAAHHRSQAFSRERMCEQFADLLG